MQFKLFSLILFLLKVSTAEACKCAVTLDFSVEEIEKYAYIAVVKIGQKTPMDSSALTQRELPYYFTAEIDEITVFKGNPRQSLKIQGGMREFGYYSSCDYGIDEGETWLIFASKVGREIELTPCTRTIEIDSIQPDLRWRNEEANSRVRLLEKWRIEERD